MSATDIKDAETLLKNARKELVLHENNLATIQTKVNDLIRQRDTIQKQIDDKVANTNIMFSEQRGRIEAERTFVQNERTKLEAGKKEIAVQMDVLQTERAAFQKEKEEAQGTLARAKNIRSNVDQFIVAVKRAYDVLG